MHIRIGQKKPLKKPDLKYYFSFYWSFTHFYSLSEQDQSTIYSNVLLFFIIYDTNTLVLCLCTYLTNCRKEMGLNWANFAIFDPEFVEYKKVSDFASLRNDHLTFA